MRKLGLGAGDLSSLASEVLLRGGWMTFTVTGTSMLPTLRTGDLIRVEPCDPLSVEHGELVLYRAADGGGGPPPRGFGRPGMPHSQRRRPAAGGCRDRAR